MASQNSGVVPALGRGRQGSLKGTGKNGMKGVVKGETAGRGRPPAECLRTSVRKRELVKGEKRENIFSSCINTDLRDDLNAHVLGR